MKTDEDQLQYYDLNLRDYTKKLYIFYTLLYFRLHKLIICAK